MMFLVRSAFWLSIVYAHMPLDQAQVVGAANEAQGAIIASAKTAAGISCAQDDVSCRAVFRAAAGAVLPSEVEHASSAPIRTHRAAAPKSVRPSINSLSAADLAAPWRGRQAKSGA